VAREMQVAAPLVELLSQLLPGLQLRTPPLPLLTLLCAFL